MSNYAARDWLLALLSPQLSQDKNNFCDAYERRIDVIRGNRSGGSNDVYYSRASQRASLCRFHSWRWHSSSSSAVMVKEHHLTLFVTSNSHAPLPSGLCVACDGISCVAAWLSWAFTNESYLGVSAALTGGKSFQNSRGPSADRETAKISLTSHTFSIKHTHTQSITLCGTLLSPLRPLSVEKFGLMFAMAAIPLGKQCGDWRADSSSFHSGVFWSTASLLDPSTPLHRSCWVLFAGVFGAHKETLLPGLFYLARPHKALSHHTENRPVYQNLSPDPGTLPPRELGALFWTRNDFSHRFA